MSLNDFEIIKQIGTGAFSTVSLVKRKQDDTIYALKRVELSKMMPNEKDNSLNEIRLLASVNHKNIISYKESFYEESTNTLNLILEYADAGDLQSKITAHKNAGKYFNEKTIWSIFIQMVNGIKELHDRNIIHRDLKSANIFLMKNGICKLGDLNVSKVANSGLLKTQTGTPYFASPEVWSGKPYGLKSDIWSLGCILYQITTLKMPFQGSNFKEVYNNISKCKFQPLPTFYSKELDLIIKKLLQIDPEKRPNCQQILEDPIVIGKLKSLLGTDLYSIFEEDKETEENLPKKKADNENEIVKKINNDKIANSRKHKTTSHLLKTMKYTKDSDINDILPKNKRYKMYNNYRIFKNYDTNPSSNKEEKNKILNENDNKLCNDINTDNINKNGRGKNRIFHNKSKIEKYKTFLKAKSNLSEFENKSESMNRNNSINKTINKTRSIPYINHQNKTEGNSMNKKIKNSNDNNNNNNQVKIPFLISKNKKEFTLEPKRIKFGIPRNFSNTTQKMPRKSLSENKNSKYCNIKNFNNYQYKKITPLITNSINENEYDKEINDNIRDINMWNNNRHINRLSDIVNQTDIDNKDSHQNTAEKGKSYTYDKKLENKNSFNLDNKNKKNFHSLSKNKMYQNKKFEENKESNYSKQFRKSIPIRYSINKNISAAAIEDYPVRPIIKVSNLFNNEGFNEFNSKINSYLSNNSNNSFHYSFKKRNVKRNNSTFEMNDKENQKLFRIYGASLKNNNSQSGIGIENKNLNKNKYSIHSEKLKMPNTKMSKTKIKINKYSTKNNHKKLLFKKNIINILEYNQYDNRENSNLYNLINYSNTTSNRVNIYRKNNNSENSKNNTNIYKSISSISIDKPLIYNTHSNNINLTNNYYSNKSNEDNSKDNSKDNLVIETKKLSAFKFDEFKQKKMKKEVNCNKNNKVNDNDKKKFIKFNHMPFINTPNKESEPILPKQRENPSFSDKNNKNIDPTIKMLINPIKIIEKKNFKRKLFPLRTQVKLNKLNILNNTSYKNNNKEYVTSIQKNI